MIDGASNTTTTLTDTDAGFPGVIAVNPVTNKIYVANNTSVSVIYGATNSITNVPVGIEPDAIAVNPVTNKIYVANFHGTWYWSTVTVIDGATNSTVTLSDDGWPDAIAVNPVTNTIYVANWASNNVTVINGVVHSLSTTTVSADVNPQSAGSNVTFTAYVVPTSGTGTPTGTVTFFDGWVVLSQMPLDSTGHAVYTSSSLAVGSHTINVNYWGDPNFSPSSSLTEQINPAPTVAPSGPPNFSVTASPTTLVLQQGQPGTVTISLNGINGYTGTMNFSCGTLPAGLGCSFASPSLTAKADGSAVTSVLTVTAAGSSAMLNQRSVRPLFAMYWTIGFGAFGFVLVSGGARRKPLVMIGLAGC